jgi:hypothetical protein
MGAPEIEDLYFRIQSPFPGSRPAAVSAALTAQCNPLGLLPPCPSRSFRAPTPVHGVTGPHCMAMLDSARLMKKKIEENQWSG